MPLKPAEPPLVQNLSHRPVPPSDDRKLDFYGNAVVTAVPTVAEIFHNYLTTPLENRLGPLLPPRVASRNRHEFFLFLSFFFFTNRIDISIRSQLPKNASFVIAPRVYLSLVEDPISRFSLDTPEK